MKGKGVLGMTPHVDTHVSPRVPIMMMLLLMAWWIKKSIF